MAKKQRGIGSIGRLVFGVSGLALAVLTIAIWLNYLVRPARAMVQGEKATVTVTHCDGTGLDSTCFARWSGGSGKLDGHAEPGHQVAARVFDGKAYPTALKNWYPRLILGLVGLASGVLAQFMVRTSLGRRK